LLLQGLRDRVFAADNSRALQTEQDEYNVRRAPKISPEDRHVDWNSWTAEDILRKHRVIGPLWNMAVINRDGMVAEKRIIWATGFRRSSNPCNPPPPHGIPIRADDTSLLIRTADGVLLESDEVKVEGKRQQGAWQAARHAGMFHSGPKGSASSEQFIEPLR